MAEHEGEGGGLEIPGETERPPLRIWELLLTVLLAIIGTVATILVLSYVLAVLPEPSALFATPAAPSSVTERDAPCVLAARRRAFLRLDCGGVSVTAAVAGAVPVVGVPHADSVAAFNEGIDDFFALAEGQDASCRIFDRTGAGAGVPLASCTAGAVLLGHFLVATGRADPDRPEIVAVVPEADVGLGAARAVADATGLGLRDDVAAAAAARRASVQTWLATIVGVCAAIGVYVGSSRRRLKDIRWTIEAHLSDCERALRPFLHKGTDEVGPIHEKLDDLKRYLERTGSEGDNAVRDLLKEISRLRDLSGELSKNPSASRIAFGQRVTKLGKAVRAYARNRTA